MTLDEMALGLKVAYRGESYVVRKIDTNAGNVLIRPWRQRMGAGSLHVEPDLLKAYSPHRKSPHAGTCQVCARPIQAAKGNIAHHGYSRPYGHGYQTASCFGAHYAPFERARDGLRKWIEVCQRRLVVLNETIRRCENEPRMMISRLETFTDADGCRRHKLVNYIFSDSKYGEVRRVHLSKLKAERDGLAGEIAAQVKRHDEWKLERETP